jgi:hypothetical protein
MPNAKISTLIAFYRQIHSANPAKTDRTKLIGIFEDAAKIEKNAKPDQFVKSFDLVQRVATEVSEGEFIQFCNSSEIPPMRLSSAEMELVKGGSLASKVFWAAFGLAVNLLT